jgi:Hsp20/alpha crystallin family protein
VPSIIQQRLACPSRVSRQAFEEGSGPPGLAAIPEAREQLRFAPARKIFATTLETKSSFANFCSPPCVASRRLMGRGAQTGTGLSGAARTHFALWRIWLCARMTSRPWGVRPLVATLFDLAETAQRAGEDNYPPYNIERLTDDRYQSSLAVAGFSPDEITVTAELNVVTIEGSKASKTEREVDRGGQARGAAADNHAVVRFRASRSHENPGVSGVSSTRGSASIRGSVQSVAIAILPPPRFKQEQPLNLRRSERIAASVGRRRRALETSPGSQHPRESGRPSTLDPIHSVLRQSDFFHGTAPCYAATSRDVERRRVGLPPGGWRGRPSSSHRTSRKSSMVTGALRPAGARGEVQEAIADASDDQDVRMARFSETDSEGCPARPLDDRRSCRDAAARQCRTRCRQKRSSAAWSPPFLNEVPVPRVHRRAALL